MNKKTLLIARAQAGKKRLIGLQIFKNQAQKPSRWALSNDCFISFPIVQLHPDQCSNQPAKHCSTSSNPLQIIHCFIMELADALLYWAEHRSSSYTITLIPDSSDINYMSVRSFRADKKSSADDDGMWILTVSGDCEIDTNFEPYSVVFKIPNKFNPDTFTFEVSGWITMSVTTAQDV
jgi:hypothetical protein